MAKDAKQDRENAVRAEQGRQLVERYAQMPRVGVDESNARDAISQILHWIASRELARRMVADGGEPYEPDETGAEEFARVELTMAWDNFTAEWQGEE